MITEPHTGLIPDDDPNFDEKLLRKFEARVAGNAIDLALKELKAERWLITSPRLVTVIISSERTDVVGCSEKDVGRAEFVFKRILATSEREGMTK